MTYGIGDSVRLNQSGRNVFPAMAHRIGTVRRIHQDRVWVSWTKATHIDYSSGYDIRFIEKIPNVRELTSAEYQQRVAFLDKFNIALPLVENV